MHMDIGRRVKVYRSFNQNTEPECTLRVVDITTSGNATDGLTHIIVGEVERGNENAGRIMHVESDKCRYILDE